MMRGRVPLRYGAGFVVGVGLVVGLQASTFQVAQPVTSNPQPDRAEPQTTREHPQTGTCLALATLSEQAAALTGALALIEASERPAQAEQAAEQIRALAEAARQMEDGRDLAGVLEDLAASLESYASGDPAGLAGVSGASFGKLRTTSARNAGLRDRYRACIGGTQ